MSDFTIDVNVGDPGDGQLLSTQSAFYDGPTDPTFFTVVGDFKAFIADTSGDVDADPDTSPITATVTFTPMVDTGDLILATHVNPRPTAYVPAPIVGTIGTDGRLKLATAAFGDYPFTPIRLLADTPLLELSSPLFYTVSFTNVIIDGKSSSIKPFTFQAPNGDVEINLVSIYRTPGQAASGIVKIAPTGVRYENDAMIFTYGGVDIPDPLPLADITGPQGEAATIEVGTVTTVSPTSPATVTNSGDFNAATFDFELPQGIPATLAVGDVTTVSPTTPASVTNVGSSGDAVFDFEIPQGIQGEAATIQIGNVSKVLPEEELSITNGGTANDAVFNFEIPQGYAATIEVGTVTNLAPNSSPTVVNSGTTGEAVFDFGIPEGEAATVEIGTVDTVLPGVPATVTNSGDNHDAVFNFEIPQGEAATISVGTVDTVAPNQFATVTNSGTTGEAVLDFEIPQGETGEKGDAATVTIGTITTVSPTSEASVTNVGTTYDAILNFSIPKGDTGSADQTEWSSIPNKPAVVASGATYADARDSIDAEYTGNKGIALGYAGLDSAGKVPYSQLPSSIMAYQGVWNASTNTPTLADGSGDQGDTYRVNGSGTVNFGSGAIEFTAGDYVIYNGTSWEKSDGTDGVVSVAGKTGTVTLVKADVGLSDVDNTSDAVKPISTATQTALDGKEPTITAGVTSQYWRGDKTFQTLDKSTVGLGNVDNTSDVNKPVSTAAQTALAGKEPTITAGASGQYWTGAKTFATLDKNAVGLGNVDNTSDATKNSASATLTNKAISGASNTVTNLPASATPDAARLVCSTANGAIGTEDGPNTWAKIATWTPGTAQNVDATLVLQVVNATASSGSDSAIVVLHGRQVNAVSLNPFVDIIAKGGGGTAIGIDSFKAISNGYNTKIELWMQKKVNYCTFKVYELSKNIGGVPASTLTYHDNSPWQSATPTGTAVNAQSSGVTAFGVPVVTTTGTQSLTNKAISGASNTLTNIPATSVTGMTSDWARLVVSTVPGGISAEDGANTWAKILTVSPATQQFADFQFLLSVVAASTSVHDSAIISCQFRSNGTGQNPTASVDMIAKAGTGNLIVADSFKIISGGWSTDMELWIKKNSIYGGFGVYELSRRSSNFPTVTYNTNATWQSAVPTGSAVNASSAGVQAFGVPVVTTTGTASLTNKTISGASNTVTNLGVAAIGASGTPSSTTFLRGDGAWAAALTSGGALGAPSSGNVSACVGQVADLSIVAFAANTTRSAGTGDFPFGIKLQRAITFSAVHYRAATADASGNLVVELRKNGVAVSGTAATIAAASQVAGGSVTGGSWAFAAGDIITVQVTGVGTTTGKGLIADLAGLTT